MELYYPKATKVPGPARKIIQSRSKYIGITMHSAEGWRAGSDYEINRTDRNSGWHFFVDVDGSVVQYYPLNAVIIHAGSWANLNTVAIEHAGLTGQALTTAQRQASVDLVKWLAENGGFTLERYKTLFGHNDAQTVGSPTTCPAGRIPFSAYFTGTVTPATYTVQRTDTLGEIAQRFNVSMDNLLAWNDIADKNVIYVGQVLNLMKPADPPPPDKLYTAEQYDAAVTEARHAGRKEGRAEGLEKGRKDMKEEVIKAVLAIPNG